MIVAQKDIAVLFEPLIAEFEAITVRVAQRFMTQLADELRIFQPIEVGIYIKLFHLLFFLGCPCAVLQ